MSSGFAESHVEEAALAWLAELGYATATGLDIGPDGDVPERASYGDVLLVKRVGDAIAKLNPTLATETRAEVLNKLVQAETPSLVTENRRLHRYMTEGVPVDVRRPDGSIGGEQVQLIDFDDPDANDWLAVNQYTIIENKAKRRPDVVIFVNGLPLGVIELKNPGDENATLDGAFNQLQTYKSQIASLFRTNAALVISDGIAASIGSLTAERERFMPWRTVTGDGVVLKGAPELETVIKGVFDRRRFLDLIKDFVVFGDTGSDVVKILAGYHQFHAVRKAVESTLSATAQGGDRKAGVIWHTQGSGKSLLMAFYSGQIIKHPLMQNPTLVVLTDRNDLDDQLFGTFSMCKDLLRQTPIQAEDRDHLRKLLDRPSGGVIFTTLQKFSPEDGSTGYPVLTDRRNVIVIADEAHRSQYGFRAKVDSKSGDISYGFAKYLRDGLPNASFIVPLALEALATGLNGDNQHEEALAVANRCLQMNNADVQLLCWRDKAEALYGLGRVQDAKATVERALRQPAVMEWDVKTKETLREFLAELNMPFDPAAYGTPLPDSGRAVRSQAQPSQQADVPLNTNGGVFVVPVEINGAITLDFAVDSGAADVSIPLRHSIN
jgi:type I restriction enzyme R subunit